VLKKLFLEANCQLPPKYFENVSETLSQKVLGKDFDNITKNFQPGFPKYCSELSLIRTGLLLKIFIKYFIEHLVKSNCKLCSKCFKNLSDIFTRKDVVKDLGNISQNFQARFR